MFQEKLFEKYAFGLCLILPICFLTGSLLFNLVSVTVSIYIFIYIIFNKKYYLLIEKANIFLFLLLIIFFLSSVFSEYKLNSFENLISFILNIILFYGLYVLILKDENKLILLSKIVSIIILIICIDLWFQNIIGKNIFGFPKQQAGRLTSIFKDNQIPGSVLFKLSPFIIYYLYRIKKSNILFKYKYFFFIFVYFSILSTGERAASILITLLLIFLILMNLKLVNKKKLLLYFLTITVLSVPFFQYGGSVIKQRINYTINHQIYNNVYFDFYKNSFELSKKNPVIGTGLQSYRYECPKIDKVCSTHPHNFLLELLSDTGYFSPILFLIFLFINLLQKLKLNQNLKLKSLVVSYTILFFFPLIPTGSFFTSYHMTLTWFSLGFIYSIKKL
jgi:O-antigen ligase